MPEATQVKTKLERLRQKKLSSKTSTKEKPYYYPNHNLYTKQEFELLDTIYSLEPPAGNTRNEEITLLDDFWEKKDLTNSHKKKNFTKNFIWFFYGVMLTSILWLIFYEFKVYEIKTKDSTSIVYHKTTKLVTDKTVDKEVMKTLKKEAIETQENLLAIQSVPIKKESVFSKWFKLKPKQKVIPTKSTMPTARSHVVGSGDSLWVIANKYYSNPSPENINKIAKANKLKLSSSLQPGQKLLVPE